MGWLLRLWRVWMLVELAGRCFGRFGVLRLWRVWRGFALAGLNAGASKNYY